MLAANHGSGRLPSISTSSKKKRSKQPDEIDAADLWIAPRSNLKGENSDRAWNDRRAAPTHSRLLELADIALGVKKTEPPRKRNGVSGKDSPKR